MALTIDTINISPVFTKCSIYLCEKCEAYEDNKGRGVNVSPVPRKTPEKYGKRRNVEEMENGDTKGGAAKTMKYTLARSNSVCSSDASSQEATYNLSLIHISEPTRLLSISYAVFCLKKKNQPNPPPP